MSTEDSRIVGFLKPIGIGLVIAGAFVVTYLVALHKPTAHGLPVAVVAPAPAVAQIRQAVGVTTGGPLDLRAAVGPQEARHQLKTGQVVGVYLPGAGQSWLWVASAQGLAVSQTVTGIFTGVSDATGSRLEVVDVVPLARGDPRGLSLFYLVFGITLGAFIFGQTSHLYAKRLSASGKLIQALSFAVPLGLTGAVIAHTWLRVQPGPLLTIAGVLALLALAAGLFTIALTELFGDPGIAVATLVAVILGNVVAGGATPVYFLPAGFRHLTPALPSGAATQALRHLAYFDPGAAARPVLVLAAWAAVSAVVTAVLARRRRAPHRLAANQPHPVDASRHVQPVESPARLPAATTAAGSANAPARPDAGPHHS
ncbi:MAG TPA: hypothetical protein VIV12_02355 [Streptosporangiaceae bacterium]